MTRTLLVRYGTIPEAARFQTESSETLERGQRVVVRTQRGTEIGTLLEELKQTTAEQNGTSSAEPGGFEFLRSATSDDENQAAELRSECDAEFSTWRARFEKWNVTLELIEMEWLLDKEKLVLYVLNEHQLDRAKIVIQSAADGLGTVEVQSVNAEGLIPIAAGGGGCSSGGG